MKLAATIHLVPCTQPVFGVIDAMDFGSPQVLHLLNILTSSRYLSVTSGNNMEYSTPDVVKSI